MLINKGCIYRNILRKRIIKISFIFEFTLISKNNAASIANYGNCVVKRDILFAVTVKIEQPA